MRGGVSTDNGPTVIVVQQNDADEGVNGVEDVDDDDPEGNEDDDSDSVDTNSGNPLLEDIVPDDDGEQDGVLTDDEETQGGNGQTEGLTFNAEGVRRSNRVHRAPSSYIPSRQGNKYQYQGTVNL